MESGRGAGTEPAGSGGSLGAPLPPGHAAAGTCPVCRKTFKTRKLMNKHIRSVHEAVPVTGPWLRDDGSGDLCGQRFKTKDTLRIHARNQHTDR